MYRSKRYNEAIALFQFFFNQSNIVPNIVSYNNVINTHCDEGRVDVALDVYRHIIANAPFSPSPVTYRRLTKGLIVANRIDEALDLLREMLNKGHGADSLVYNNLILGFLNLEKLDKANQLFDELKERCLVYDGVVNATNMEWFFNKGMDKEAMESYNSLMDRHFRMTPATCNVLLEVLLRHGKKSEAWALFEQMLDNHTPPHFQAVNSDTFNVMVNDCFKLGKFAQALTTFRKAGTKPNSKPFAMDVGGYNNIIARFCENGMLSEAETLFEELCSKSLSPDVPTHRTLIDAYLKMERIDDALRVLNRMVDAGLRVVASFGNRVFDELIKSGKAIDCAQVLTKMGEKDPKPDPTCYEVVIKGLCAGDLLDKSQELLDEVMRYGIGVTPTLREFVIKTFMKVGRGGEIERLLDMNRFGHSPLPSGPRRPYHPASGPPPYTSGQHYHHPSEFTPHMARTHQTTSGLSPEMTGHHYVPSGSSSQMAGLQPYGTPSGASPQMAAHQPRGTPSGPQQMAGQHHPWTRPTPPMSGPSYGTPAQMSPPYYTAPGPSSHMTGPYHPSLGFRNPSSV